jgi:chemotaxis protein methyltransferase CheR
VRQPRLGEGITLRPDEFRLLRDLFATRVGLQFGPESRFSLERRLRERLMVLKLSSFAEYHHYLRFGSNAADEWDEAVDLLTTNETYFFREDRQLRAFQYEILPMLETLARPRRRLAIWSAGCSTGEEVYTIAILVHMSGLFPTRAPAKAGNGSDSPSRSSGPFRAAPRVRDTAPVSAPAPWGVRVYGSDISRRCVAAARRGVYAESSFRATPDDVRRGFFCERADGWHVDDSIRQVCHFGQMNLLDEDRSRVLGRADAIFCRNVLIYFDARARKSAIELLYDRLNPGGVLLLGHSESLLNVSTAFELLHLRDDLVYRRPVSPRGSNGDPDDPS